MAGAFQLDAFQFDAFQESAAHGLIWARASYGVIARAEVLTVISAAIVLHDHARMSPMPPLFFGTRVDVKVTFRDSDDVKFDPEIVRFIVIRPDGTTVDITHPDADIINPETGVYSYSLLLDQVGDYRWRWESTGPDEEAAQEGRITVPPRLV